MCRKILARVAPYVLVAAVAGKGVAGSERWEAQLKSLWPQDFLKIHFCGPTRGWLLGQWGTLLRTLDGGASWSQVLWRDSLGCEVMAGPPGSECYGPEACGMAVVHDSLLWVVGVGHLCPELDPKGFVLHSPDGGVTWKWQLSVPFRPLRDVLFVNQWRGWAVGDSGTVLSTCDGGQTWAAQSSGTSANLQAVFFADTLWGWVVGAEGTVLHSANGGATWQPVPVPKAAFVDVLFVDRLHGWILGSAHSVLRTIDGGNSWEQVRITDLDFPLNSLCFLDRRQGWVAVGRPRGWQGRPAEGPSLFATVDGGHTWVARMVPFAPAASEVVFASTESGFLVGAEGTIFRTTNGGQEWRPLMPVPARALRRVYFADQVHGWVTGDRLSLRTSDGGETWLPCPYVPWLAMFFSDGLRGWALGDSVYHTEDGGRTWVSLPPPVFSSPLAGFILDDRLGWVSYLSPGSSLLARTRDGGRSWQISDSMPLEVRGLFFVDSCRGWAVGNSGLYPTVFLTSDGGASWTQQYQGSAPYCFFQDVFFADHLVGWAVGASPSIRTVDGGRTWEERGPSGSCVHFVNPLEGWISGYHTEDGGNTWQAHGSDEEARMFCNDLYFVDSAHGWGVGINGSIYRWVPALGVRRGVPPPTGFRLVGYPNPCSGNIVILLSPRGDEPRWLEVRNISGQVVRRLPVLRGGLGDKVIRWDGKDEHGVECPAGVYLVRADSEWRGAQWKIVLLR